MSTTPRFLSDIDELKAVLAEIYAELEAEDGPTPPPSSPQALTPSNMQALTVPARAAQWDTIRGRLRTRLALIDGPRHLIVDQIHASMERINNIAPQPVYFVKDDQLAYRRASSASLFTPRSEATLGIHLGENLYVEEVHTSKKGVQSILEQEIDNKILTLLLEAPPFHLPRLVASVHTPFLATTHDGSIEIITQSGYHAPTGFWLDLPDSLAGVAAEVERFSSIDEAVRVITHDLLHDFHTRWPSRRDLAHYLAVMCEPFVRPLIDGVTPLNFFSADDPGSGKSLLARFHGAVAFGITEKLDTVPWTGNAADDHAMVKMFPGVAARNNGYVFMDNIKKSITSPNLALMVTEGAFSCDVKYLTAVPRFDIKWQWLLTGNKPNFDFDLGRRMIRIAIAAQPHGQRPAEYKWNISNIAANRVKFVAAILYMCREGLRTGTQLRRPYFDSFEAYMRVLWPIMVNAGFADDFDPASNTLENASDDGTAWEAIARTAYALQVSTGRKLFTAKDLWESVVALHSLDVPGLRVGFATNEHAQATALGKALGQAPRTMGAYRMEVVRQGKGKAYVFSQTGVDEFQPDEVTDSAQAEADDSGMTQAEFEEACNDVE